MKRNQDRKVIGNILIVDDLVANLHLLSQLLQNKGYEVRGVTNGKMTLKTVRIKPPDVILLDIKMPKGDGYKVCEALKSDDKTRDIPVIFLSALDGVSDKVKAFRVGAVDYITKPFRIEEVIARIENQLTIQKQKLLLVNEIEQRQRAEAILSQSRNLLEIVLNSSRDGISAWKAVRDLNGTIADFSCLIVNPVVAEALGKKREDCNSNLMLKKLLTRLDVQLFDIFVAVVETGETLDRDFYYEQDNRQSWYNVMAVKLEDGFSVTVRDITQRKRWELELNRLANLDGLTQVANRRSFNHTLTVEWRRCNCEKEPLSLILCDVDYFKRYNDRYGHQMGDDCLVRVAKALSLAAKHPRDLVARYGGEEFALILPDTDQDGAIIVGEWIGEQIRKLQIPHLDSDVREWVTLSLGIATIVPTDNVLPKTLVATADKALYEAKAKAKGRDCLVVASQSPVT